MTEQEYINVKELIIVSSAKKLLSDVTPEISDVIPISQLQDMIKMLSHWEIKLADRIKTNTP